MSQAVVFPVAVQYFRVATGPACNDVKRAVLTGSRYGLSCRPGRTDLGKVELSLVRDRYCFR
jgi:hypothetical protein